MATHAGQEIRRLASVEEFEASLVIGANAYPGWSSGRPATETRRAIAERMLSQESPDRPVQLYGLFRDGRLLGQMRLFDFTMTLFETPVLVGGLGSVAVDLAHKKEKVARDLVAYYLRHYRTRGAPLAALYAFRPDFYKAMGFGYGPRMNTYHIAPDAFPADGDRANVRWLTADDAAMVSACYERVTARTHGMMRQIEPERQRMFTDEALRVVGYVVDGELRGYLTFTFKSAGAENPMHNDLVVERLVYENSAALRALLAFLRSQSDQVHRVVVHTQDDAFPYLLADPRNGSHRLAPHVYHETNAQGLGLMYRILDTRAYFAALRDHRFGYGGVGAPDCVVKLTIADDFLPENDGSVLIRFTDGRPHVMDTPDAPYDVELRLGVADFSSLAMGCVSLRSLYTYGLATISDATWLDPLTRLFAVERGPVCQTDF